MKLILATGIYPPDIGGPATYVQEMARELLEMGHAVTVVTYRNSEFARLPDGQGIRNSELDSAASCMWRIVRVSRAGGPLLRWCRYAWALHKHGKNADIVYAFSSVSVGIPLRMARLHKPKKILRLGGDFLWERYTDWGGKKGLRDWLRVASYGLRVSCPEIVRRASFWLLKHFDYVVFSSAFQRDLYETCSRNSKPETRNAPLPSHCVIENAVPAGIPVHHEKHVPLRLLFLGRFVRFKQLHVLIDAVARMHTVTLTIAGSGPLQREYEKKVASLGIANRVRFLGNRQGKEKQKIFLEHDLLVLPSLTEISPNVALEARAVGLPVLLTKENGLSASLQRGMVIRDLSSVSAMVKAIEEVTRKYKDIAEQCAEPSPMRSWLMVAQEHHALFTSLFPLL